MVAPIAVTLLVLRLPQLCFLNQAALLHETLQM